MGEITAAAVTASIGTAARPMMVAGVVTATAPLITGTPQMTGAAGIPMNMTDEGGMTIVVPATAAAQVMNAAMIIDVLLALGIARQGIGATMTAAQIDVPVLTVARDLIEAPATNAGTTTAAMIAGMTAETEMTAAATVGKTEIVVTAVVPMGSTPAYRRVRHMEL